MTPLEKVEDIITRMICGDAVFTTSGTNQLWVSGDSCKEEKDGGSKLKFLPMQPKCSYALDLMENSDRMIALDAGLLINPAQDILGNETEIAFIKNSSLVWTGYRRLHRIPKNIWISQRGATLYECHHRTVFDNGKSTYLHRVGAISSRGIPVSVVVVGTAGSGSRLDSEQLISAASIVEDAHRPNALTATITDSASVILAVPLGEHKSLFALRDAPLTPAGRRKAIIHWVSEHVRRSREKEADVKAHWRGVRELSIDGLSVKLETNGR